MDGVLTRQLPFHGSCLPWPPIAWLLWQPHGRIVVAGLLASGLPMRLFNPPTVDVLRLRP